ncbi:NAD-dependent epimerase/dehydratase family protein [Kutzneria kofuensis]|uniref:UDP-glucose 4-epimerase n=1 Tax=Kutzneria kofuensis TaxID=103725 RepID=A0A7W9NFX0_9PSEU|nr:NAD(P)-dependent oxidoreductase [Kutzneria kofuensis]MBB5891050.1 nucleoside-diphosphate-sugar epimerase [Kutzneria kofuensis]
MRVLVTGAFGNIGSSAVAQLRRQGHEVRCFDVPSKANLRRARGATNVVWADIRDADAVQRAVRDQDVVVHLAGLIPPQVAEDPQTARDVNVGGTGNVLDAVARHNSRILFASTLDVYGPTQHLDPPRRVDDPVARTDEYSGHKIRCEELVRQSPRPWAIYRFADVPPDEARRPHPIMFAIPLDNRIELVHRDDAGLAVANGVAADIWGGTWLIGGGPSCQVRYRDMLGRALDAFGLGALPDSAFSTEPYCTDWLDTEESQRVLRFQRHSFDEIMAYVVECSRPALAARLVLPLVRPLARRRILKLSPHF